MIFPDNSASWEPPERFDDTDGLIPEFGRGVPLIKVLGVGGGGSNAVSRMYKEKLPVGRILRVEHRRTAPGPVRRALPDPAGPQPDARDWAPAPNRNWVARRLRSRGPKLNRR